jgi:hypothetical protein
LEEVFQKIPQDVVFNIELKDSKNKEAQKELIRIIQKYKRQSTTIIGASREDHTL